MPLLLSHCRITSSSSSFRTRLLIPTTTTRLHRSKAYFRCSLPSSSVPSSKSPLLLSTTTSTTPRHERLNPFIMGHSHDRGHAGHSHSHDNTLLLSTDKNDAGVRITKIGLYSNLAMAIAKGAGGVAFGSQAMVADAWHSATDLASDILTLATVSWSLRRPTDMFPTGFGKVESLGSLGVSGMLLVGGLYMCVNSLEVLYATLMLDPHAAKEMLEHAHGHSHSHGHGHGDGVPSLNAAWLAAGTVVIKEWLYQATMKVARERKSSVLASNAVHHRVDSLTGIVTLFAILGANIFTSMAWLDSVGGLLISLLVIRAGFSNTTSALYELADKSIDAEVSSSIRTHAEAYLSSSFAEEEIILRNVTGVKSGQNYLVDLDVGVPPSWTVEKIRRVEAGVRAAVGEKVRGVRRIKVRFVSVGEAEPVSFLDEFVGGDGGELEGERKGEGECGHEHEHKHEHEK